MLLRRFFLWFFLLLAVIAAVGIALSRPLIGQAARSQLADAGFRNVQLDVAALSPRHLRLENIVANEGGRDTLRFEFVEADFNLVDLIVRREIEGLRIGPGNVRLSLSPDGTLSIPGLKLQGGDGGALPFQSLSLAEVDVTIETPIGDARGKADGSFNAATGGDLSFVFSADRAGTEQYSVENANVAFEGTFSAEEILQLTGTFEGDFIADAFSARRSIATIKAANLSRNFEFEDAAVNFGTDELTLNSLSSSSGVARVMETAFGEAASSFSAGAKASVSRQGGIWAIHTNSQNGAFKVKADNGASLTISPNGNSAILTKNGAALNTAFAFALTSEKLNATGALSGERNEESWRIAGPVNFGPLDADRVKFESAATQITMTPVNDDINIDLAVVADLALGKIGRLNIFDAPIDATFNTVISLDDQRAIVRQSAECLLLEDVRATIDRQDTELLLSGASFCADGEPVAEITWDDEIVSVMRGRLVADRAHYRLGSTHLIGAPPEVDAVAVYRPALNKTVIDGAIDGGMMALNDLLNLAESKGNFTFALEKEVMRVELRFDQTRVSQRREPMLVAPALASGYLSLLRQDATFDYIVTTLDGARIGAGTGDHNVSTAKGKSRLTFDELQFADGGMQPAQLLPVLRGFARDATGTARGFADFWWDRGEGISSSAEFELENVTFTGPTRIVNQTRALNGLISFADLWPLRTDGLQTVTVEGADLDALQLQEGEIVFDMPGDETLRVERANFPWFGGSLGVDGAVMAYSGGEAVAPLRADGVDLQQLFDHISIDGLSGEGLLSGVLPLVVEDGRARIENGLLTSDTPGAIRYQGQAAEAAGQSGGQAKTAFDLLRDLRYDNLEARIEGPLDGRLQFRISLQGTGEVDFNRENVRVPVNYNINLDAALLELLQQAQLSRRIELQIDRGIRDQE